MFGARCSRYAVGVLLKRGFKALVVDDDDFSRSTAVRILKRLGAAEVAEAAHGNEALRLADACGGDIDLVLCDLRMPQLDGIETLDRLAALNRSTMFVLASSAEPRLLRAAASTAQRAGIGALRVISKPVTICKLQEIVADLAQSTTPTMGETPTHRRTDADPAPSPHRFSADDIRRGLARGEFTTFYQPKVEIPTRRVCGAEALIRWRHPLHGVLPPSAFMPVAQANGLLGEVFFVALPASVAACANWRQAGHDSGVSINLPTAALASRDLPNRLEEFVTAQGLGPEHVTFEVTEDGWLHEQDLAREVLTRLRIRGFGLAIDDFGTGYSGVQQLLNAPFNELKIDQGFIRAAPVDAEAAIALASIVALARQLDLSVVAEGVETQEQWDLAAAAGCDQIQGYLVARPLTAERFEEFLAKAADAALAPTG